MIACELECTCIADAVRIVQICHIHAIVALLHVLWLCAAHTYMCVCAVCFTAARAPPTPVVHDMGQERRHNTICSAQPAALAGTRNPCAAWRRGRSCWCRAMFLAIARSLWGRGSHNCNGSRPCCCTTSLPTVQHIRSNRDNSWCAH
jgi:hypothetical protein